jgi:hypothetical protein
VLLVSPDVLLLCALQGKRQYSDYSHSRQQQEGEGYGDEDVPMKRVRGPRGGRKHRRGGQHNENGGYQDGDEAMQDAEVRAALGVVCCSARCTLALITLQHSRRGRSCARIEMAVMNSRQAGQLKWPTNIRLLIPAAASAYLESRG